MESSSPEKEKAQPASNLLDLCPRLAAKWATTYADLWKTVAPEAARMWGNVFLKDNPKDKALLKAAATIELRKRGLIPPEPQGPTAA